MRYLFRLSIVMSLFIVAFIAHTPVRADDAIVTDCTIFTGPGSISDAVDDANMNTGGTITFACTGVIDFANELIISNDVIINGGGVITFDGGDVTPLFVVNPSQSLTLNELTLQNGDTVGNGGAILNASGTLTVTNSTFIGNSADGTGGAILNDTGTVTITNSTFRDNSATNGGAIFNATGITLDITNSIFRDNSAGVGGAIFNNNSTVSSTDSHYENNTCVNSGGGVINDLGGNTRNTAVTSAVCPGSDPIALNVDVIMCFGANLLVTINRGDENFDITGGGPNLPLTDRLSGSYVILGAGTWTNVVVRERRGERELIPLGGITCPSGVITPPTTAPTTTSSAPAVTVLGCALDTSDGVEVANAPDNTYCRVLMKNGGVVSYSGAIPADLIGLGVILAVDVYRLEGGATMNTFPDYARICLQGEGRFFYMDGRNAPRYSIEMTSEVVNGMTCAWIPAPGTVILTK